ncbi:MAG: hypothetical protein PVF54_08845, partial [Anaerolineae bacterium]
MYSESLTSAGGRAFASENALGELRAEIGACRRCLEAGFSVAPSAVFSGPASAWLMVIGQAPGSTEWEG